jgi:glycogen operon protein
VEIGQVSEGRPEPLGVTPTESGVNVAVHSTTATAIEVCFFDHANREHRVPLPARTGPIFHGHVAGVGEGARYGLRAHGLFDPERGHRFDASKLLVDPFARLLDSPLRLHPSMFSHPGDPLCSAAHLAKAVVTAEPSAAGPRLVVPWEQTVIYEAHVRGLTMRHPDVPEAIRGTFAALAHPAVVDHLTRLGVTTLELLPTAAWIDERHLGPLGLTNYWGYNPVAFCAPDPRLAPGGWAEVRAATAALAESGIETVLDVVFNHTGEGDALGPTLSLRGLDNAHAYWLHPDDPARYIDDSGTGNTLRCDTAFGVRLAMEAMRTWVRMGGVSGFRFDLATVLGRRANGYDAQAPLLAAIDQDPELRGLKLIAEPWDCGPGGYQLGRFPATWGEWNDRYRDTVRRFWQGADLSLGQLAGRIAGSQDMFGARTRPSRSVNFVTAHDGFTLADLVAFQHKRNEANGEANRDGTDNNSSWNNGVEGPSADPAVLARRAADQRALLATLILSRGTPMLSMGAELGQTQGGNNNAYAQDNEISWLAWDRADEALSAFAAQLVALRRDHPALHRDAFLTGECDACPEPDVAWLTFAGEPLHAWDWDDPQGASLQMALAARTADGKVDRVAVLFHRRGEPASARLPQPAPGCTWTLAADSAAPERSGLSLGLEVEVGPRSVTVVVETKSGRPGGGPSDEALAALASAAGISPEWWSLDGERHAVTPDTQRALLDAMGLPVDSAQAVREALWLLDRDRRDPLPACRVVRSGHEVVLRLAPAASWVSLRDEEGRTTPVRLHAGEARLPELPPGVYQVECGARHGQLIVAPPRGFEPELLRFGHRRFGLSAQVYALRRDGDQGVGDFTTLAELGRRAGELGAAVVAINPLHALFPQNRDRASPYYPSDRRFLEPLYLDLSALGAPGAAATGALDIDYPGVWARKAAALERLVPDLLENPELRQEFEAFVDASGQALETFAAFQALSEARGDPWSQWPEPLRDPKSRQVAEFAQAHAGRVRHHKALQWLCDRQLAAAAEQAPAFGFCRDLAVGAAPDGAEAWAAGGRLARSVSIGAPPDAFSPQGQVWGLPPPIPERWRAEGYASFRELLAANMRHAGALRIDHVLGLSRLFWVPEGGEGKDGAYVAYPEQELLGIVALESQRARCLVVGEDLGTVPDGLRDALRDSGLYSYQVLQFEREGDRYRSPSTYRPQAVACVSTHDLPPLAGWWEGADLTERAALGLLPEGLEQAQAQRRADKAALLTALREHGFDDADPDTALSPEVAAAIHAFVAHGPSRLVLVQAEDLAQARVSVNLPGTDRERPNWRRRTDLPVEQLGADAYSRAILSALASARAVSA